MDDLMCDPSVYQIVESPNNTSSERMDTREVCYQPENTYRGPAQERRMNRSMTMGPSVFHMRLTTTRMMSRKR